MFRERAFCVCACKPYVHVLDAGGAEAGAFLSWLAEVRGRRRDDELIDALTAAFPARAPAELRISLRSRGERAEVLARLEGREIVLSNDLRPPRAMLGAIRPASVHATFMLAARWLLGHERLGCADPLEDAFWFSRGRFAAYVVEEAPRAFLESPPPWKASFYACLCGGFDGPSLFGAMSRAREQWVVPDDRSVVAARFFDGRAVGQDELDVAALTEWVA